MEKVALSGEFMKIPFIASSLDRDPSGESMAKKPTTVHAARLALHVFATLHVWECDVLGRI